MRSESEHVNRRLVEYDAFRRRLWILGQRCHHGATGSLVAGAAFLGLIAAPHAERQPARPLIAAVLTGSALMVHDWKDRPIWFERGHGSQP